MSLAACRLLFALVLAACCVGPATASAQDALPWEKSLDAALEKAKAEKRPILICMHWDQEKACIEMLRDVYSDSEVRAHMRDFILVGTCPDGHEETTATVDGKEEKVSALFGGVSCDVLVANEKSVKQRWFEGNAVTVPQHLFVDPDGEIYLRKVYQLNKSKFIDLMREAKGVYTDEAVKDVDGRVRAYLLAVKNGKAAERKSAIRAVIEIGDEHVNDLLFNTIDVLKKDKDRAACIRAVGYRDLAGFGPGLVRFLEDGEDEIVNAAVVSLEETAFEPATPRLIALYAETKDEEIKKDVLRALGATAKGDEAAKAVLVAAMKEKNDRLRRSAYLSLGDFLREDPELRDALVAAYEDEGGSFDMKGAILVAFYRSGDPESVPALDAMMEKEKNNQLVQFADLARERMKGGQPRDRAVWGFVRDVIADDKIKRNVVLDFRGGGRGGR